MSELLVNTIKKADGTGSLSVPAESGTVVVKDGSNDVTLNNITATGVYLGGTGAANYLDDYEEGTFTPIFLNPPSSGTVTSLAGQYIKIGDVAHLFIQVTGSSMAIAVQARIAGLPFNIAGTDQYSSGVFSSLSNVNASGFLLVLTGTSQLYMSAQATGVAQYTIQISHRTT